MQRVWEERESPPSLPLRRMTLLVRYSNFSSFAHATLAKKNLENEGATHDKLHTYFFFFFITSTTVESRTPDAQH